MWQIYWKGKEWEDRDQFRAFEMKQAGVDCTVNKGHSSGDCGKRVSVVINFGNGTSYLCLVMGRMRNGELNDDRQVWDRSKFGKIVQPMEMEKGNRMGEA